MSPPLFAHLDNPDGTRESICLTCYKVLVTTPNCGEFEQQVLEADHDCAVEWQREQRAGIAAA